MDKEVLGAGVLLFGGGGDGFRFKIASQSQGQILALASAIFQNKVLNTF